MGSCALIWAEYSWPICTSCCVETPQAAVDAAIAIPTKSFLIVEYRLSCRVVTAKWQEAFPPTALNLKLLTLARDLKRRKAREKKRLFVAEGVRAVEELLRSPLT